MKIKYKRFFIKKPKKYKLPLKKKRKNLRNSIRKFSRKIRMLHGLPRKKWRPRGYFNLFCKLTQLPSPLKFIRKKRKIKVSNVGVGITPYRKFSIKKVLLKKIHRKKINTILYNFKKKSIHLFKGRKRILSILRKICKSTPKIDKISKTLRIFMRKYTRSIKYSRGFNKRKTNFSFTGHSNMRMLGIKRIFRKRRHRRFRQYKRRGALIFRLAYKLNNGRDKTGKLFYKIPNIFYNNFRKKIRKIAPIYNFSNKRSARKVFFKDMMIYSNNNFGLKKYRTPFMKVSTTLDRKKLKINKHNLL